MLKKYLISNMVIWLLFLQVHFVNCMEQENLDESDEMVQLSSLSELPPELVNQIMIFLGNHNIENLLDSAQHLYSSTTNLRSTSKQFHQMIEGLIVNPCQEGLDSMTVDARIHLLQNCNCDNYLGATLILTSLINNLSKSDEQDSDISDLRNLLRYKILKNSFGKKLILFSGSESLQYDFSKGTAEQINELIDLLINIATLEKSENDKRIIEILNIKNIIIEIIKANRKDLFLELVLKPNFKEVSGLSETRYNIVKKIAEKQMSEHARTILSFALFRRAHTTEDVNHFEKRNIIDDELGMNSLKWAIIFDNTDYLKIMLDYLDNTSHLRDYHVEILEMLNFASTLGSPETLDFVLNYYNFHQHMMGYILDQPLQRAFDAGHEDNFMVLIRYGANTKKLSLRQTTANEQSTLCQKFIAGQRFARKTQEEINKRRITRKKIAPKKIIKIINEHPQKEQHRRTILYALSTAVVGLAAYQLFKRAPNYIQLSKAIQLKSSLK